MAAAPITYSDFFQAAMGSAPDRPAPEPYPWQEDVARGSLPVLLDVPTGLGKTEGIVLAWAYRRLVLGDEAEPRHLVYCLPMRVLVRQTEARLRACFENLVSAGILPQPPVVYVMLGGDVQQGWVERPEDPWVVIGTQDQLLSRALNRGYAMSRFQWPVHFGLLNSDCRWVVDEVQLMGPGLWTTAQLDGMRNRRFQTLFGCPTTWMSATIGSSFLETRDRRDAGMTPPQPLGITRADEEKAGRRLRARRPIEELRSKRKESLEEIIAPRCLESLPGKEETEHRFALSRDLGRNEQAELRGIAGVRRAARQAFRPGMRHEAASALAMWARCRNGAAPFPMLSVYLAACHHGKVRTFLRAWTQDGDDVCGVPPEPPELQASAGAWPMHFAVAGDGLGGNWNEREFVPTEHGWTALVHDLLGPLDAGEADSLGVVPPSEPRKLGPFALAYLEALVRIADWRASARPSSSTVP